MDLPVHRDKEFIDKCRYQSLPYFVANMNFCLYGLSNESELSHVTDLRYDVECRTFGEINALKSAHVSRKF